MSSKSTNDSEPFIDEDLADQIDDLLFRKFMAAYAEEEGKAFVEFARSLPDSEESKLTPEKRAAFQKRMKKARQAKRPKRSPRIRKLKILIPAVALLALLGLTAGAHRIHLLNFFGVSTPVANEYVPKSSDGRPYEFLYIPDNFAEQLYDFENNVLHAYFWDLNDRENFINVYMYFHQPIVGEDNEDLTSDEPDFSINDNPAAITQKNGVTKIVWSAPDPNSLSSEDYPIRIHVSTTLSKPEATKFAENILPSNASK